MGERYDVFLSHAWGDHVDAARVAACPQREGVERLRDDLRAARLRVFYDEGSIEQFDRLAGTIRASLDASKVLVAWCSDLYLSRPACAAELTHAITATIGASEPRVLVVNTEADVEHLPGPLREQLVPPAPMPDDDDGFAALVDRIVDRVRRVEGGLGDEAAGRTPTEWYPEEIDSSTRFTGRFRELWDLHGALTGSALASQREVRSGVVVSGMGGSGKSMLVVEYAHRFAAAWPGGIVWLTGHGFDHDEPTSTAESAHRSLEFLATTDLGIDVADLSLGELRSEIERWFEERVDGPVLWVVDDLADDADLDAWVAPMDDAVTVVTTRVGTYDGVMQPVRLDELSEVDAVALLTRDHPPVDDAQRAAASAIVERLGHHALSLDVTRGRVQSPGDYVELLDRLERRTLATLERAGRHVGQLAHDHSASIVATLQDSIDDLTEQGSTMLDLLSVLDSAAVPDDLVAAALASLWGVDGNPDDPEHDHLEDVHDEAIDGLLDLERHSLARRDGATTRVHRLVIDVVREQSSDPIVHEGDEIRRGRTRRGMLGRLRGAAARMTGRSAPSREDLRNAMAEAATDALLDAVDPREQRVLYDLTCDLEVDVDSGLPAALAGVDGDLRRHEVAVDRLNRWVERLDLELGADDPTTLRARGDLADAVGELDPDEGVARWRALFADHERILGRDDHDTIWARKGLASQLTFADDDEAIEQRQLIIDEFARTVGLDHRDTLWARRDLAGTLMVLGYVDDAIDQGRAALAEFERVFGVEAEDTVRVHQSLALNLRSAGHTDAVGEAAEAARRFAALFGDDHPDTVWAVGLLAATMVEAGDERAVEVYRSVVDDSIRVLGDDHPVTLEARVHLAEAVGVFGDVDDARSQLRAVIDDCERVLGADHADTIAAGEVLVALDAG